MPHPCFGKLRIDNVLSSHLLDRTGFRKETPDNPYTENEIKELTPLLQKASEEIQAEDISSLKDMYGKLGIEKYKPTPQAPASTVKSGEEKAVAGSGVISGDKVWEDAKKDGSETGGDFSDMEFIIKGSDYVKAEIPVDKLIENDEQLREFLKTEPAKEKGRKITQPIIVTNIPIGDEIQIDGIADGFNRVAQAVANGDKTIVAYVQSKSELIKPSEQTAPSKLPKGEEQNKSEQNETIQEGDSGTKPVISKEKSDTEKLATKTSQKKSVLERPIEEVSIDDILKELEGDEGLAFKDASNKDIKGGDSKSIEAYNQRAANILKSLYPDAEFKALETTKEYQEATGRKGEAGVLIRGKDGKHKLFLNLEAIRNSNIERTATHEVIHAIVSDAIGVKYADLRSKWDNLWPKLSGVKGFEVVKEHIKNYSALDRPVEGITDLLANIVHGEIKIEDVPKDIVDKFIEFINRAFEAVGIDYKITPDTFNGFASAVKEAFDTGDLTNLQKFTSKGKTEKFLKAHPGIAEASAMIDPQKRKALIALLNKKVAAEIKTGKLTQDEANKIFEKAGIKKLATEADEGAAEPPTGEPPEIKVIEDREGQDLSGIKKALVSEEVVKGVDFERVGDKVMMAMGRKILDSGEVNPDALVTKIITEGKGVLTPAEVVGLITYKRDIDNAVKDKTTEFNKKKAAGEETGTLGVEIAKLEKQIEDYNVMSLVTAQQQSLAFRLRQYLLDQNYNAVREIERYKKVNNGTIPPEVEARIKAVEKELKEVKEKLAKAEEANRNAEGQEAVDNIKEKTDRENQQKSEKEKKTFKERAKRAADTFRKLKTKPFKFKDENGNEYDVTKMGFSWNDLVELGARAIEKTGEIADGIKAVFDKIQNAAWYKKLSEKDKKRVFTELEDYYKKEAEDSPEGRRIKQLEKQLEDLQQGIVKSRNEPIDSPRIQELKEQIFEAKKNLGLIPSKMGVPKTNYGLKITPEHKRLERLEKELDDLRRGIIKERATKLEDTPESKRLKDEIYEAKKNLGLIKGKPLPEPPVIKLNDDGSLSIPPKMIEDLVAKGVTDINELVENIYDEAVKIKPEVTKREVRDYITGYGEKVNPTATDLDTQISTTKRVGKLLSELEDLQKMTGAQFLLKYQRPKPNSNKITDAEREIKRKIRALIKDDFGDIELKTDEQKIKEDKQRVRDRILDLERQKRTGSFSKKKKKVRPMDIELEKLKIEENNLIAEVEELQYKNELKNRGFWQKAEDEIIEWTQGLTRGLILGVDLSAGGIQGMRHLFISPVKSAQAFWESLKFLANEKYGDRFLARTKASPYYPQMAQTGLIIDDKVSKVNIKDAVGISNKVNYLWNKLIAPVLGIGNKAATEWFRKMNPYAAGQRAFNGYVNVLRTKLYIEQAKELERSGYTFESDPEVFKKSAGLANTETASAHLGKADQNSKWLNYIFTAPRKFVSEFKLYTPYALIYYARLPKPVRKRALLNAARFTVSFLTVNAAIWALRKDWDDEEEDHFWDITSSDFLTHKIGNKRIGIGGGMKSMLNLMGRFWTGKYTDQYGKTTKLGERFGKEINSEADLIISFTAGKATPLLGSVYKKLDESKGREVDNEELIINLFLPMWMQDLKEVYKDDPVTVGAFINIMSILGAQARVVDESKRKQQTFKIYQKTGDKVRESTEADIEAAKKDAENIYKKQLEDAEKNKGWGYNKYGEMTIDDDKITTKKKADYNKLSDEDKKELQDRLKKSSSDKSKTNIKY